jgi:hypothetical protein
MSFVTLSKSITLGKDTDTKEGSYNDLNTVITAYHV